MRDSYKSYSSEEFDTIDEWFESLDDNEKFNLILDYTDSEILIYSMDTFNEAFTEDFRDMSAIEIVEYVNVNLRDFNPSCKFWGENTYGNLIADDDPLWLAECCGLEPQDFWNWLEENFDDVASFI